MKPFDLQKALAGAKLVTRDGREVHGFRGAGTPSSKFPYAARIAGDVPSHDYGSDGRWWGTGESEPHELDLFLSDDEPITLTPRAQIMAMLAAGWLADGGKNEDWTQVEWVRYFRDLADDILRVEAEK